MAKRPLIFMSAGEASGDHYGAEIIESVCAVMPDARFTGLGGKAMETAGQRRVIRAEDVAVMGITEILRHVPRILRSYRTLVRSIHAEHPDVAVLIDFPDVNFRLARHLRRLGVPVIWFVSPQLWAWKRRRLRWVQSRVDKMLTIFPFEEEFYRRRGVSAEFVGHPLAEAAPPHTHAAAVCTGSSIRRAESVPAQFVPGALTPETLLGAGNRSRQPSVRVGLQQALGCAVAGESPWRNHHKPACHGRSREAARRRLRVPDPGRTWHRGGSPEVHGGHCPSVPTREASATHHLRTGRACCPHAQPAAVVASGTATVQAAVVGTPFVAVYRVSRTTFWLARRLVQYPPEMGATVDEHGNLPIVMPNLIAGHRVVPELLQEQFTAQAVAAALLPLLQDGPARSAQIAGLAQVRAQLLRSDGVRSMDRVRDAVLDALNTAHPQPSSAEALSASNG